jgi:tricorn protease
VRVTSDGECYRYGPVWSPDSKKLLYWDKKLRLWYVDINEKKPVLIDKDDYQDLNGGAWSPDSRWVTYTKSLPNFSTAVYLYSLEQKKVVPVSNGFYNDFNPVFDQNGKYLYFLSDRYFFPSGGRFDSRFNYYNTTGIFAVTLKADEASPFAPQSDEEEMKKEEKKDDKEKPKEGEAGRNRSRRREPRPSRRRKKEKRRRKRSSRFRWTPTASARASPRFRCHPAPTSTCKRNGKIFYLAIPMSRCRPACRPPRPRNVLHVFDLKEREDKVLLEGINNYDLDKEGKKAIYRADRTYGVVEVVRARPRRARASSTPEACKHWSTRAPSGKKFSRRPGASSAISIGTPT